MTREGASAPNIKGLVPRSLGPSACLCPAHLAGVSLLPAVVAPFLADIAGEEEFGVQEAGGHIPPPQQVLLCSGKRGEDFSPQISLIPGTDSAPPACSNTLDLPSLGLFLDREDVDLVYSVG